MVRGYDVIVVGSGFGGAVVACRLAAAGAKVLVLERGRRWEPGTYPRKLGDPWLFDPDRPLRKNGWLDLRLFPGMAVAQGAGVGGGSLCYSSVVMEADAWRFDQGWPPEVTAEELAPHYLRVRTMLGVRPIPDGQVTQRHRLTREAAVQAGYGARFRSMPLAITFDPDWNYDLPDPLNPEHSRPFDNPQGRRQGTCVHLGNCDIGCDVRAKNTLDLNYIPEAERHGAEVRPLHLVRAVRPDRGGYRVAFDRIESRRLMRSEERAGLVVLAAGSLGSTELLLRCRDEFATLPRVGRRLGRGWSANANVLTPAVYPDPATVRQSVGPTISAGIDFMDGDASGERFLVEDDGFPNMLLNAAGARLGSDWLSPLAWSLRMSLRRGPQEKNALSRVMLWLGAGIDAADGRLYLGRHWSAPWKKRLCLGWKVGPSEKVIRAILAAHGRLTKVGGGKLHVPWYWSLLRALVTVHPLGGCRMGKSPEDGVVDHRGEVFGYPGLYVADGSVLPVPLGRNPSMTIAALAERTAALMTASR